MAEQINMPYEVSGATPPSEDTSQHSVDNQQTQNPSENTEGRPEWLPEKFKSPEDLAKAYSELEKKQGSQGQQEAPAKEADDNNLGIPDESVDEAKEAVEGTGYSLEQMAEVYYETGDLAEEHYAALEAKGISKSYVDAYFQGITAQSELMAMKTYDMAGGQENYKQMVQWAANTFSDAEKQAYDNAINSLDMETRKLALQGLQSRFQKEYGSSPEVLRGSGGNGESGGYQSMQQVVAAMQDPRYKTDPAYRSEVERKAKQSQLGNKRTL